MDASSAEQSDRYAVLDAPRPRLRDILLRWEVILAILLVLTVVVNTIVSPYFLDIFNLADATFNFSEKAIIALGMALLILVREIDRKPWFDVPLEDLRRPGELELAVGRGGAVDHVQRLGP